MGNIYSYRNEWVGIEDNSGSGRGSDVRETGLGSAAELDVADGDALGPLGASSPSSPSSSTSQEESFFGWRRKSEEGAHVGTDTDGRLSLAETIPLEEAFPELMRLEDGGSQDHGASGGKLRDAGYAPRVDDMSSRVPQGFDKPVVPNVGSSSGTRSVGSGGSQSIRSQGRKESHHRGSLEVEEIEEIEEIEEVGGEGYGMQRRASGTSARGSLTLERANARANRSSFDAFQKALEEQVCVCDGEGVFISFLGDAFV